MSNSKYELIEVNGQLVELKGQIYRIINTSKQVYNQYTGQTRTHYKHGGGYIPFGYKKRFEAHIREAIGEYRHLYAKLYMAIRKYGPEVFIVELVEECPIIDLDKRERYWISQFDSFKNGYNMTIGGQDIYVVSEDIKLMRMQRYQHQPETPKPERPKFIGPLPKLSDLDSSYLSEREMDLLSEFEELSILDVKLSKVVMSSTLWWIGVSVRYVDNSNSRRYKTINIGGGRSTFRISISKAIEFALCLVKSENIIIQEKLYGYVDMVLYQADDAKQQNANGQMASNLKKRLATFVDIEVSKAELRKYTSSGRNVIAAYIHADTIKKIDFGGKHTTIQEALIRAVDFITKICPIEKITVPKDLAHLVPGCQTAGNQ